MPATREENGTWFARFYYTTYDGKRKQKGKRGFPTKREALEYEREFLAKASFSNNMSFKSLVELYLEDTEQRVKRATLKTKKNAAYDKLIPFFGDTPVDEITPILVRKWQNTIITGYNFRTGKKFSEAYIRQIHTQLSTIFNYAVKFHNLKENPCRKAGPVGKPGRQEFNIWTREEFETFCKFVKRNIKYYTAFQCLFWTGMRIGELLALNFEDVNLVKKEIRINKTSCKIGKTEIITEPKTAKSKRTISITDNLVEILREYMGKIYAPLPTTRVFTFSRSAFHGYMIRKCEHSGVHRIRIHDLRHSHASLLINAGVNPLAVSERLGHERIEMTLNVYSHLYNKTRDELMELLNKM